MFKELVTQTRSVRRFFQEHEINRDTLLELVDLARLSASGMNKQPLKYIVCCDPAKNAEIFPNLGWAGYLKEWPGPENGERPAAYIVILNDKRISEYFGCDHGIAAQSIMLGATEKGLGGCMIATINKSGLKKVLAIEEHLEILLVLALGKPKETIVLDEVTPEGTIQYWRDENQVHHVPKRTLKEIVI